MRSNVLKGKIVEAGYTQRALAKEMNMSKNTLNRKVNGKIAFDTDEVIRLCDILNIIDVNERAYIFLS